MTRRIAAGLLAVALAVGLATPGYAQSDTAPGAAPPPGGEASTASGGLYKPPLRGAPGGRIGGASRSAALPAGSLPVVELLAPGDHSGVSARPDPTLYFYISGPSRWPTQFTISAPMQPKPLVEVTIPSPSAAGIFAVPTGSYRVHLQPGVVYTWSIALVIDPRAWSHNLVASATVVYDAESRTGPSGGAAALADAGLWYDAVAAAVEQQSSDARSTLSKLMQQVGLTAALGSDGGARVR